MAKVINKKTGLHTVGELIEALKKFDPEMPLDVEGENVATVYQTVPTKGETPEHPQGEVCVCGIDPWGED